jgi:site-specific DNA-methyltransferase (adenine-specific)
MQWEVLHGDCREKLRDLADASIDAIVTDPPYELGFMGKSWDASGIAYDVDLWREALRVLKPGGHLLAFSGSRTYHRMTVAIEDAGFEIRDQIMWVYGSGFPKSKNLDGEWQGWGTALKPAHEPICVARKPLIGTVAENVLTHGTGALNIDASRIPTDPSVDDPRLGGAGSWSSSKMAKNAYGDFAGREVGSSALGRWPANLIHDGSDEVLAGFPSPHGAGRARSADEGTHGGKSGMFWVGGPAMRFGDSGSAARFFYCPKASKADRAGSKHPTVKPIALMAYLVRLVTPKGGTVLDPFAGSGTTLQAAVQEGFRVIGIEQDETYIGDIYARMERFKDEKAANADLFDVR